MSTNIEGLGTFYLGREYDLATKKQLAQPLLYDSKDLVTHAVCVGMTGSGKTGLCIDLIEEAAIDGIPSLVIDPKGDLSNLMLTFPQLRAEDFAPWVNADDAARKGVPVADFAAQQSDLWKSGLAKWDQSGDRIQKLKDAADFTIYTPGSSAGVPISVLKSFDPPVGPAAEDTELFTERVQSTATSLLGLMGIDADPVQSREHILIANLLQTAWQKGQSLDLATLIGQIQTPPFARIGVLELEAFYPSKDRFKLAMQLNNLLASPGFASWLDGVPLDVASFLYTPQGKPRVAIFSIAHLSDAERMFFVSLLLNQTIAWMRQQPGTTSLRALLYMDEIFGYFPPVANPPSKTPLLTLLKQARAYGLGCVLATQNPVDLDYKGLSNAGTWFIGRLQTERDKARVLEGLEGASAAAGARFDKGGMEETLAGLGSRVFLMNNVHDDHPVIFESRWALSYLRGPLTRDQIKRFAPPVPAGTASQARAAGLAAAVNLEKQAIGVANIRYSDTKTKSEFDCAITMVAPIDGRTNTPDWDQNTDMSGQELEGDPAPPNLAKPWQSSFAAYLAANAKLDLLYSEKLDLRQAPDEAAADFRTEYAQKLREARDSDVNDLRTKYASKIATLEDRIRKAQAAKAKQAEQSHSAMIDTVIKVGGGLLGAFFGGGRKSTSITKVITAGKAATRTYGESQDVNRAEENVEALQEQLTTLQAQVESEIQSLQDAYDPAKAQLQTITMRPKKTAIVVKGISIRNV
jgi:hypothetical protein